MDDATAQCADEAAVLAEVDRFAVRCVEPKSTRPEVPMCPAMLDEVLGEARGLGLVPGDEPGLGLWDDAGVGPRRSLRALDRLARANAAVALALHVESLARVVARVVAGSSTMAASKLEGTGAIALEGRFGLGRGSLARLLVGAPLDEDDRATLRDVYGSSVRMLTGSPDFAWVLWPDVEEREDRVVWRWLPRASLDVRRHANAHGLDELSTMSIERRFIGDSSSSSSSSSREFEFAFEFDGEGPGRDEWARALALHALGLVAIAAGAASRAHAQARAFAATRRQGGALIERHAAVALLLASSRGALESVGRGLDSFGRTLVEPGMLPAAFALRAEAHPLLCRGVNDALQVFGGTGYMRDVGLEKVVRDLNHLRVVAGSPPELALVVAEWERLRG